MAAESHNARKKRRNRMNVSRANRQLHDTLIKFGQTQIALFQVLTELGGKVEVQRASTQTVITQLQKLGWKTSKGPEGSESIVFELVHADALLDDTAAPADAVEVTEEEEEPDAFKTMRQAEFGSPDTDPASQGAD